MTDKREERLSALMDDDVPPDFLLTAEKDPDMAAMAETVQRIRSARTYEPPSPDFAERGWLNIVRETGNAVSPRVRRRPVWKRTAWLTAAASLLVAAVLFTTQPWTRSTVSASEIRVTGSGMLADLGVHEALYPRYAGSLDSVSYGSEDKVLLWNRADHNTVPFPLDFDYMRDASWSPDGRRVAFAGYKSGRPGPSAPGIWIATREGTDAAEIVKRADTETSYENPAWSPDGKRIAFTLVRSTLSDEVGVTYERSIVVVNTDGSGWTEAGEGKQPAWSRNGKQLAYTIETPQGLPEIWIADIDGEQPARKLADGQYPSWSASRPFLVFTKTRSEHRTLRSDQAGKETFAADVTYQELWAVNVESGTETRLTNSAYPQRQIELMLEESDQRGEAEAHYQVSGVTSDEDASWSPDGTRIVFTRNTFAEKGPHYSLQEIFVEYK